MYAAMSRPVPWAKTTDSAPYFSFMSMNFSVMRSYASSQVMRSHLSLPRSLGSRFMGYSRRSLWFVTSGTSKQRMHRRPPVHGSSGSPSHLTILPSSSVYMITPQPRWHPGPVQAAPRVACSPPSSYLKGLSWSMVQYCSAMPTSSSCPRLSLGMRIPGPPDLRSARSPPC